MKCILAAVDGSEASLKAVDFAADMARIYACPLLLLAVVPRAEIPISSAELDAYARSEHLQLTASEIANADAEEILAKARTRATAQGLTKIDTEATIGDPTSEIIALAKDRRADVIVVGSRGRGQLAGLLLGSVAHKVVSHAHCPVVVVH